VRVYWVKVERMREGFVSSVEVMAFGFGILTVYLGFKMLSYLQRLTALVIILLDTVLY